MNVPQDWDGRVLFLDPNGETQLLQVANFPLPDQEGFEPPEELPPGEEDPIKAMTGDDLLITFIPVGRGGATLNGPLALRAADFLTRGDPRIPRGHALARRLFCLADRCFQVDVDFATPPSEQVLADANAVLATFRQDHSIGKTGQTQVELSGKSSETDRDVSRSRGQCSAGCTT